MNTASRHTRYLLIATLLGCTAAAQQGLEDNSGKTTLKGYVKAIAGETLDYNCFNPIATTALLTRCTTGEMKIEWETEPIPSDIKGESATFQWIASYSTITSAGDRSFGLYVNNEKCFTIQTKKGVNPRSWSLKSATGEELAFRMVKEDAARDANGYMFLRVPLSRYPKGHPLILKVVGEKANSSDWYMTFMYDLREQNIEVFPLPFLTAKGNERRQIVCVAIGYLGEKGSVRISLDGGQDEKRTLKRGPNSFEFSVPAVNTPREVAATVTIDSSPAVTFKTVLKPVLPRTIYLLPHSHNDIGYTDIQTEVLRKQVKNIYDALALIRKSAGFPAEARFKWNVEVLWSVESFLKTAPESSRTEFFNAVKNGSICLEGLYANVLTGIMRPEEFFRLTEFARKLETEHDIRIRTAMISDVPGMSWNMIPALVQTGVRYFSSGPNGLYTGGDRTGHTNRAWADRPFYWVSPSGQERLLFWTTGFGYGSFFAGISSGNDRQLSFLRSVSRYFAWLDEIAYPYDIIQMRHTINGDNGTVDPDLSEYVKGWNERYLSPKIVISTSEQMFVDFEKRYGESIPSFAGDLTPYWEDGAASTAYELGLNRKASELLVQAEALHAMIAPGTYEDRKFTDAWRNVLLFDEHTWGAHNSITDPDSSFVAAQWAIKEQFALDAARQSQDLFNAVAGKPPGANVVHRFDVINTNVWPRTDLVILPKSLNRAGDRVTDEQGKEIPSQRLANGDLAVLAGNVPPLAAQRYHLEAGKPSFTSNLTIKENVIADDDLELEINPVTGSICHLRTKQPERDLVDTSGSTGLNEYLYVAGLDAREAKRTNPVTITVQERGPLVSSFLVESTAPGARALRREIRLINGLRRVDLLDTVDKLRVRSKEALHFGFPFAVPDGVVRIDLGFAVIRPDADQLAGSCKDYYSAQRWVDVSNQDFGVTLTVDEAPLIEVGPLHSELPSPRDVSWRIRQEPSSHLASYVMNNYWHTNYRASQEGVSTFHYSILPHGLFSQPAVTRAGLERSQPLVVRSVGDNEPKPEVLFSLSSPNIVVTSMKPNGPGRACVVRLFNSGGRPEDATIDVPGGNRKVYLSNPFGEKGERVHTLRFPVNGIITVRIE